MQTARNPQPLLFADADRREVVADFAGGAIGSDAGALLPCATGEAIGLVERFGACFRDRRSAAHVVHDPAAMVDRRVLAIALCGACSRYGRSRARGEGPIDDDGRGGGADRHRDPGALAA